MYLLYFCISLCFSKPSCLLQKPTKTKTFCTKFPTTQSSRYTLWLTQPKMGTLAEWLQPDSRFCLHSRLLVFSTSFVRGPLEGCRTGVLQGCHKLTWMRSDSPKRMQKGGFIWFCSFLTLYFFLEILLISVSRNFCCNCKMFQAIVKQTLAHLIIIMAKCGCRFLFIPSIVKCFQIFITCCLVSNWAKHLYKERMLQSLELSKHLLVRCL